METLPKEETVMNEGISPHSAEIISELDWIVDGQRSWLVGDNAPSGI